MERAAFIRRRSAPRLRSEMICRRRFKSGKNLSRLRSRAVTKSEIILRWESGRARLLLRRLKVRQSQSEKLARVGRVDQNVILVVGDDGRRNVVCVPCGR